MAQRRMFSQKIVSSDAFLDMPTSSRELYFQLGMYADDDGFINPKKVVRMIGASDDDLKVLIAKRFVIPFENGVVVIKHWKINNLIRKDFYQETIYEEQKKELKLKENNAYTERKQNVNNPLPQVRLGKVRLDQDSIGKPSTNVEGGNPQFGTSEINELLNYGQTLGFAATKQTLNRYAINRLLKSKTVEQLKKAAEFSQQIRDEAYAPQVNNWLDLEEKYLKLRDWVKRQKPKETKHLAL